MAKQLWAQAGTPLTARLTQSVATAVTVVVVRGARTVVVRCVIPAQLQADEYSALLSHEEAYVGIALGVTVTWRASTTRAAFSRFARVGPGGTNEVTVIVLCNELLVHGLSVFGRVCGQEDLPCWGRDHNGHEAGAIDRAGCKIWEASPSARDLTVAVIACAVTLLENGSQAKAGESESENYRSLHLITEHVDDARLT